MGPASNCSWLSLLSYQSQNVTSHPIIPGTWQTTYSETRDAPNSVGYHTWRCSSFHSKASCIIFLGSIPLGTAKAGFFGLLKVDDWDLHDCMTPTYCGERKEFWPDQKQLFFGFLYKCRFGSDHATKLSCMIRFKLQVPAVRVRSSCLYIPHTPQIVLGVL